MLRFAQQFHTRSISSCSVSSFESINADSQSNTTLKEFCKNYYFDFTNFMDFYEARSFFSEYLRNIGYSCYVQCLEAMENFQKLFSAENRYKEAAHIVNMYMTPNSIYWSYLQFPSSIVDPIVKNIQTTKKCSRELFDPAVECMLQQMQLKFFNKFLDSADFIEFIKLGLRKHGKRMFNQLGKRKQEVIQQYKATPSCTPMSPKPSDEPETISVSTFDLLSEDCQDDSPLEQDVATQELCLEEQLEELEQHRNSSSLDGAPGIPIVTAPAIVSLSDQEKCLAIKATLQQFQQKMDHRCIEDAIYQEDFDLLHFMASEDPCIKSTLYKPYLVTENYASYICKIPFYLGNHKTSYFLRTELVLPFEYDKVAHLDIRLDTFKAAEANVYDIKLLDVLPVDLRRRQFARSIFLEKMRIGFPFDDRYLVFACAVMDDSQRNMRFSTVSKSCKYADKATGEPIQAPKCVLCISKGGRTMIPLPSDPKKCKIIEAYCLNLSSSLSSELIAKLGASRVSARHKKLMSYLSQQFLPDGSLKNESTVKSTSDSLRLLEVMKDNLVLL